MPTVADGQSKLFDPGIIIVSLCKGDGGVSQWGSDTAVRTLCVCTHIQTPSRPDALLASGLRSGLGLGLGLGLAYCVCLPVCVLGVRGISEMASRQIFCAELP